MTILGWILDELASAAYRNSAHGPPPEHWYPPKVVRERFKLAPHQCMHCREIDPSERRITTPFCSGKPKTPSTEVA